MDWYTQRKGKQMERQADTFELNVLSKPVDEDHIDVHISLSAYCTNGQIVKCLVAIIHEFENEVPDCWGFALDKVMSEKGI